MSVLKVALLQMFGYGWDQDANLRKGEAFCRRAREMGADIALFPEMWNIAYGLHDPRRNDAPDGLAAQAIDAGSAFVAHFRSLAVELDIAIAVTYLERWDPAPRNTVVLIDRRGSVVLTYAKVHTCDFGPERLLTPGDGFRVCTLETAAGPVRVGAMICYDREQPESARILMLEGAEIILTPNACGLEDNRLLQFRTRAYENMVGVAMTNYAAPQNNGRSAAYDGVAFGGDERGYDPCLVMAGPDEGVFVASFDIERLRAYRAREIWGNAYRKPARYGRLLDDAVADPFVRPDPRSPAR